jgi:hypothetical protein
MKALALLSALTLGALPSPAGAGMTELTAGQAAAVRAGTGGSADVYRPPWFLIDRHLWIWTTLSPKAPHVGGTAQGEDRAPDEAVRDAR